MNSKYFIQPVAWTRSRDAACVEKLRLSTQGTAASDIHPSRLIEKNRTDIFLNDAMVDFSAENFSRCFEDMRRNIGAEWSIPLTFDTAASGVETHFCKLILLGSGNLVLVTALLYAQDRADFDIDTDGYREILLAQLKAAVRRIFTAADLSQDASDALDFDTPIHSVLGFPLDDPAARNVAEAAFRSEGLELSARKIATDTFDSWEIFGGWSFSAIRRKDFGEEFYFVALMVRLQSDWYALRVWRKMILSKAERPASDQSHKKLHLEHRAVHQTLFNLQKHQQEIFDYRANLKPWLANAFDGVADFWSMSSDFDFLKSTMAGFRDLISFEIQERNLAQSRVQSRILYFIAGFDTLALSGFLLSLLSFTRNPSNEISVAEDFFDTTTIIIFLCVNLVIFLSVLLFGLFRVR